MLHRRDGATTMLHRRDGATTMLHCRDGAIGLCRGTSLGALLTIPSTSWLAVTCQLWDLIQTGVCLPKSCPINLIYHRWTQSCRNLSRMINGNRMHLSSISSLITMGLNTYVNSFYIFYTFAKKIEKSVFAFIITKLFEYSNTLLCIINIDWLAKARNMLW